MTALAVNRRLGRRIAAPSHAVLLLQVFAVTVMVFPSDQVIKAIGGDGYLAALVAYCLFLAWIAAALFGIHNPLDHRYPVRISLCSLWLVSLTSYALMDRATLSIVQQTAADRWLMELAAMSGVILVAAEWLRSIDDVQRVLRALMWGGAFCGIVAALQFWLRLDISSHLRLPGFSLNQAAAANDVIGSRGGHNRVSGTAIDPIELGVVAGMLLPLAVYMAMHDAKRSKWLRWFPVICIVLAIPASVSRSAILAAGLALGVLVVTLPTAQRLTGLAAILVAFAGIFVTAHGLIGTLKQYFVAGTNDASIAHRVNNYPYVESLVRNAPWFGQGGGTYSGQQAIHILDNQYLGTAIELGLVGLAALIVFFLWPIAAALAARGRTADPVLRDLCAALAGSALAGAVCSATFDSLGFPMFVNVQALVVGLIGAAWLLVDLQSPPGTWSRMFREHAVNGEGTQHTGTGAAEPVGGD
jgi:O-antigen ligase